jgi:hypothetical protein
MDLLVTEVLLELAVVELAVVAVRQMVMALAQVSTVEVAQSSWLVQW